MKRAIIFSMFIFAVSIIEPKISWAVVKFADDEIKKDFDLIYEQYEVIQKLYDQLSISDLTYVIRYGEGKDHHVDGLIETDGKNIYLTLNKYGQYSLQAKFAHEAAHALQFETGRIAFFRNNRGEWSGVNIDVWDEAEAFQMMIPVANGADYCGIMKGESRKTGLYKFKRKLEDYGFERAAQYLSHTYKHLSLEHKNNPTVAQEASNVFWAKRGCKFFYKPYKSELINSNYCLIDNLAKE